MSKRIGVIVRVSGGNVIGAVSTSPNVFLEIFDDDNLESEGFRPSEVDNIFQILVDNAKCEHTIIPKSRRRKSNA